MLDEQAAANDVFNRTVFARARRLCLSLPGTTETWSWRHPSFRAAGKAFCAFELIKGRPSLAFRLPASEIEKLVASDLGFATPYGRGQWASVWVDGDVDWKKVQSLVRLSYGRLTHERLPRMRVSRLRTKRKPVARSVAKPRR